MSIKKDRILIVVRLEADARIESSSDLVYLLGNIEILVDETLLVLGPFPGALLLLPSIDDLADSMRKVRDGHKTIEITLTGDTSSLWLVERKADKFVGLSLSYYDITTNPVSREELDRAFEQSIDSFLEILIASKPISKWSHESLRILNNTILTWPSIARLKRKTSW